MSGLIDTIVRRRRASASSRLGPPAHLLDAHPWATEEEGAAPVNGHASVVALKERTAAPEPEHVPEAVEVPQPEDVPEAEQVPQPEDVPEAEDATVAPDQPAVLPEPKPEAAPEPDPAVEEAPEQPTTTFAAVTERPAPYTPAEPPAPVVPTAPPAPTAPAEYPPLRERIALRRRVRHLESVREIQLRDLGGFLLELHRFGRERPDLVEAKLAATAATDSELRALHHRLDEEAPIGELRRPGIGGACEHCGAVHGSLDRFCASCGEPLR